MIASASPAPAQAALLPVPTGAPPLEKLLTPTWVAAQPLDLVLWCQPQNVWTHAQRGCEQAPVHPLPQVEHRHLCKEKKSLGAHCNSRRCCCVKKAGALAARCGCCNHSSCRSAGALAAAWQQVQHRPPHPATHHRGAIS